MTTIARKEEGHGSTLFGQIEIQLKECSSRKQDDEELAGETEARNEKQTDREIDRQIDRQIDR
jgi:hypothetical protein